MDGLDAERSADRLPASGIGGAETVHAEVAIAAIEPLGWPAKCIPLIAAIEIAGVLLYAVPSTSRIGAVLLTGVLGGAMANHVRADSPLLSHTLFGIYLSLFMWGGLWLRDRALRALILRSAR